MTGNGRKTPPLSRDGSSSSNNADASGPSYSFDDDEDRFAADRRTVDDEPRRKKSGWMLFLKLTGLAFGLGTIALLGLAGFAFFYMNDLAEDVPSHQSLADYQPPVTTRVYMR